MANEPTGGATLIGQVSATVVEYDEDLEAGPPTRGPVDVNVIGDRVEVSVGSLAATLTDDETLDLTLLLLTAEATLRFARMRRMIEHARAQLEAIEMGAT